MIQKIKTILTASFALTLLSIGFVPAMAGAAAIQQSACQGAKLSVGSTDVDTEACKFNEDANGGGNPETKVNNLIADVINIFSVIVGIVAVIMIIYGGFRYITSGGDSSKITDAKNTILYAIVGLIIVAFAQFVVKFVLSRVTGGNDST